MKIAHSLRSALFGILTLLATTVAIDVRLLAQDSPAPRNRILEDIRYLSADEREGRGVGTQGLDDAAAYIRDQLQSAGVRPILPDGSFFQSFEVPNGSKLGAPNRLHIVRGEEHQELRMEQDFLPLAISGAAKFQAPIVFAGYGITAPRLGYDDYAGLDVSGKVVLVVDRGPGKSGDADPHADPHRAISGRQLDVRSKVSNAASHGAAAVLFVRDARRPDESDVLMKFGEKAELRVSRVPAVQITRHAADAILKAATGSTLAELQAAIDGDMKPRSQVLDGTRCHGEINVVQQHAVVKNVLGAIDGRGPHARETIVVGAHYDHLGYGEAGSLAPGERAVHNGADDNASGTAGLIEVARRIAERTEPLPRRVLFAAFTAEERGLIGSDHYVAQPAIPLEDTVAMINLDMIGRLRNDKLIVEGVGTAKEFRPLVESLNAQSGFQLKPVTSGRGPSDQTSFVLKNIPVLFFWTDFHPDYHKPSDDWDKVSVEGIDRIVGMVAAVVASVASAESRPTFVDVPVPAAPAGQGGQGERAYLGTIPAFGEEADGVLLSGVTSGAPAEQAGLRGGDTITQIGDISVHNLQDMQTALESHRPGERIKITVRRGNLRITYPVTLGRRQQP